VAQSDRLCKRTELSYLCDFCSEIGAFRRLKLFILGDEQVGKSSLFSCYCKNTFPAEQVYTVYDYDANTIVRNGGKSYTLRIFDAPAKEEYNRLRIVGYPETNGFLVCFNVMSPESFESVRVKWIPELRQYCPDTPILLIGTQVDRRQDAEAVGILARKNQKPVSKEQGQQLATELNVVKYLECSAMTRKGVTRIFKYATIHGAENLDQREQEMDQNLPRHF